jgi:hypothetical protein
MHELDEVFDKKAKVAQLPINWRELPHLAVSEAAAARRCSTAQIYRDIRAGRLEAVCDGGRTLIVTASLTALFDNLQPWTSRPVGAPKQRMEKAARQRARYSSNSSDTAA